jgi:uncharacterized protein YdhG (YjbR/CyaY superfamily)
MGSVDEALAALPEPARGALQRVIAIARAEAPDAVDGVSYGMPALKVKGKALLGVTADHPVPAETVAQIVRLRRQEII